MQKAIAFLMFVTLAGCQGQSDATGPDPIAAASTPDIQEGGPVTTVVQLFTFEDAGALWYVDITREAMGEPGHVAVIGPGPASRAEFFAARACLEDGGTWRTDVEPEERPLAEGARVKFVFHLACD